MMLDPKLFGPKLKELLDTLDISQTEVSEMTGLTIAAVSMILSGKRSPSLRTICSILNHIPVKFEKLVT